MAVVDDEEGEKRAPEAEAEAEAEAEEEVLQVWEISPSDAGSTCVQVLPSVLCSAAVSIP